jgi:hypothetical protein
VLRLVILERHRCIEVAEQRGDWQPHAAARRHGRFNLTKNAEQCLLLYVQVQVPIAAALLFGLVADEVVDDGLVYSLARQRRNE